MAYNTKLYKSTGSGWDEVRVASEWGLIANKPSTFTPTAHSHSEYLSVTGGTLNGSLSIGGDVTVDGKIYSAPTSDSDSDNTVVTKGYVDSKTSDATVEGLLDENDKIKASLLPSFVFGGMRFVTSMSKPVITTAEIQQSFGEFIDANGGTMRGCYAIATAALTITISEGHAFVGVEEAEIPDLSSYTYLEPNDWIIAVDDNGTTWAVINNTYQSASTSLTGIVKLATEQDGINGTSTTLAMTPKATVAAINERLGDIDTALSNILGV